MNKQYTAERIEFEAYFRDELDFDAEDFELDGDEHYTDDMINTLWMGWVARVECSTADRESAP
jgi:hypothetical protein